MEVKKWRLVPSSTNGRRHEDGASSGLVTAESVIRGLVFLLNFVETLDIGTAIIVYTGTDVNFVSAI